MQEARSVASHARHGLRRERAGSVHRVAATKRPGDRAGDGRGRRRRSPLGRRERWHATARTTPRCRPHPTPHHPGSHPTPTPFPGRVARPQRVRSSGPSRRSAKTRDGPWPSWLATRRVRTAVSHARDGPQSRDAGESSGTYSAPSGSPAGGVRRRRGVVLEASGSPAAAAGKSEGERRSETSNRAPHTTPPPTRLHPTRAAPPTRRTGLGTRRERRAGGWGQGPTRGAARTRAGSGSSHPIARRHGPVRRRWVSADHWPLNERLRATRNVCQEHPQPTPPHPLPDPFPSHPRRVAGTPRPRRTPAGKAMPGNRVEHARRVASRPCH